MNNRTNWLRWVNYEHDGLFVNDIKAEGEIYTRYKNRRIKSGQEP